MSEPTPNPADVQPIDHHQEEPDKTVHPRLQTYFSTMIEAGASDLHIKTGSQPFIRVGTQLRGLADEPLTREDITEMIESLVTADQLSHFHRYGGLDVAHQIPDGDRFRLNIFRQRGLPSIAARRVTASIPSFEQLHLPAVLEQVTQRTGGLVLLSGPTGSGKSTTIASMLEYINTRRACHIVTIEDPIEYIYHDKKALISQREVGIDVPSFDLALRSMLREDPDVVLIGEMRDYETFEAALQASETGHLVFGTVHASTAPQTVSRVLDLFPPESRDQVMLSLAYNLQAIVCQKLLPCIREDIDRVPAVEVLLNNPTVRGLLEDQRISELSEALRSHEGDGMQSFTTSLFELIENDLVDPKQAYAIAPNAEELKMRLKGITQAKSGLVGRG